MPLAKSQNITQPNTQIFKFLLLGNSVGCHSNNIQKLESGEFFFGFFIFQSTVLWTKVPLVLLIGVFNSLSTKGMVIWVVEFSNGGYKNNYIFAWILLWPKEILIFCEMEKWWGVEKQENSIFNLKFWSLEVR